MNYSGDMTNPAEKPTAHVLIQIIKRIVRDWNYDIEQKKWYYEDSEPGFGGYNPNPNRQKEYLSRKGLGVKLLDRMNVREFSSYSIVEILTIHKMIMEMLVDKEIEVNYMLTKN